ncbi:hypothetical protein LTR86_011261 [Recurvomyces mirabilis]|nr:hypothetical protein LTR86_011261 [Recurvomyces mirabilis]
MTASTAASSTTGLRSTNERASSRRGTVEPKDYWTTSMATPRLHHDSVNPADLMTPGDGGYQMYSDPGFLQNEMLGSRPIIDSSTTMTDTGDCLTTTTAQPPSPVEREWEPPLREHAMKLRKKGFGWKVIEEGVMGAKGHVDASLISDMLHDFSREHRIWTPLDDVALLSSVHAVEGDFLNRVCLKMRDEHHLHWPVETIMAKYNDLIRHYKEQGLMEKVDGGTRVQEQFGM